MKTGRLIFLSLFILLLSAGCYFVDESDTVDLDDVVEISPAVPPGTNISSIVPEILNAPSVTNPFITISFNMPVDPLTIDYSSSVTVEYPIGITVDEGTDYTATEYEPVAGVCNIYLDLGALGLTGGETIRIVLTDALEAESDPAIKLYDPVVTIDVTVLN